MFRNCARLWLDIGCVCISSTDIKPTYRSFQALERYKGSNQSSRVLILILPSTWCLAFPSYTLLLSHSNPSKYSLLHNGPCHLHACSLRLHVPNSRRSVRIFHTCWISSTNSEPLSSPAVPRYNVWRVQPAQHQSHYRHRRRPRQARFHQHQVGSNSTPKTKLTQ